MRDNKKIPMTHISKTYSKTEFIRLRAENEMLRTLLFSLPGNVYWKDAHGQYLGMNKTNANLFGTTPLEAIGKRNADFFDFNLASVIDQVDQNIQTNNLEYYSEEQGLDAHHNPAVYLTRKVPLYNKEGNLLGLLGISFDITERKRMEEELKIAKERAEAANRSKSQFLAAMNHELRTPLACMSSLIEFLKQKELADQETQGIINSLDDCAQHLFTLVNEILEFSKLEKIQYELKPAKIDLKVLLEKLHALFKILAAKKELKLEVQCNFAQVPQYILTDEQVLLHILINLVGNAIKFTNQGSVIIQVHKTGEPKRNPAKKPGLLEFKEKCELEFKIIDTGPGIPRNQFKAVFEPFKQLEDTYARTSSRSGAGLGLAIVKKLTSLLKTEVKIKSQIGQGSTFSFKTKFEIPQTTTRTIMSSNLANRKPNKIVREIPVYPNIYSVQPKILIVEDDCIMQNIQQRILMDLGCKVTTLAHGKEVMAKLKSHDLIFVDVNLPYISGFEIIRKIRNHPIHAKKPIIVLTVYTSMKEKHLCLQAGADAFVSKPLTPAHFKKLLLKFLPLEKV